MSAKRREIQFIHSSHPGLPGGTSAETQRRVHSHAAWTAHAKARRQKILKFQATKAGRHLEDRTQLYTKAPAGVEIAAISSPISLLGCGRRDPFASCARRLNPIEEFLFDYYRQNVAPCSSHPRDKFNHPGKDSQHLNAQFIQLAVTNPSSLNGLFLVASRHVSYYLPQEGPYFLQLALQYKIACARTVMEAISSLDTTYTISDATVVLPLFLAQDEILIGDMTSTKEHIRGAIQMAMHNGVLKMTDARAFPYDVIHKEIVDPPIAQQVISLAVTR